MPSLSDLLKDTMVFVAAAGARKEPVPGAGSFSQPPIPSGDVDDPDVLPIWHWKTSASLNEFTDLSAIARGMGNARMQVCDKVRFENVSVMPLAGASKSLPLEQTFLAKEFHLDSGSIAPYVANLPFLTGTHFLYPLQAELDKSILRVFAYDFPSGFGGDAVPVAEDQFSKFDFMPKPPKGGSAVGQQGQKVTASLAKPRVVVFMSLVCCKERADFEPGGILGAGRLIPHLMIMCNQPLAQSHGTVHIQRPSSLTMLEGHNHDHHQNMNSGMHSGFWADHNSLLVPSPFWDDLFDCYELNVSTGTRKVVRPDKPSRTLSNVVMDLFSQPISISTPPFIPTSPVANPYFPRDIARESKQGAFDNLHVAPTMKSSDKPAGAPYFLDKVIMAPFCEHDCLHTHWRWGTDSGASQSLGWSNPSASDTICPGQPYSVAGAPMVPDNQKVDIETINSATFKYHATAIGSSSGSPSSAISPGTYTIINHHGSGYSLSIVSSTLFFAAKAGVDAARLAFDEPSLAFIDAVSTNTANFYWHLRYGGRSGGLLFSDIVQERLLMQDFSGSSTLNRIHDE